MKALTSLQAFVSFSNQSFRRLWLDSWFWYVGRLMEIVVLSWFVLELTDSPSQVALVGVFRMTPMFLFGFLAGSLADRLPKKTVIISSHIINGLAAFCMIFVLSMRTVQPWYAYLYMLISGTAWTFDWSARRSYFSEIIDSTHLANAVALDNLVLMAGLMLGPFLGGSLIPIVGYAGTFSIITTMYLFGLILLLTLRRTYIPRRSLPAGNIYCQSIEDALAIRKNHTVLAVLMVTITLNLFGFSYQQVLPVLARNVLGVGSTLYGILGGAAGLGALIGASFLASRRIQREGIIFSLGALGMLVVLLCFSLSPIYFLSLVLLFVAGVLMSGFTTLQPIIVLNSAPPEMRGRVMGAIAMASGALPLGIWLVGYLAEAIGAQAALSLLTTAGLFVMITLRWQFPSLRE